MNGIVRYLLCLSDSFFELLFYLSTFQVSILFRRFMLISINFMSKHWNYFFYVAQWMNFAEQTMTAFEDVLNIAQNSNSITHMIWLVFAFIAKKTSSK